MAYPTQTCDNISVKLDETNYPTWAFQMQHHLRGHGFMKFIDGSHLCPPQFIVGDDGSLINNSVAREKWSEQDSLLIFMITTTLSADALTLVIGCQTSMEVWLTLKQRYAIVSESHIMQLKAALHNIKKGYESIDKYLLRFKYMRERLAVAGVGMNDQDAKFMILAGLPSEYGHTRQIIRGKGGMNMNEVRSLLLSAEYEIELKNKAYYLSSLSAMIAQCGSVCPASQNVQFSMPSNIPQIQGLYNCGYMNGNPVSSCLPIYVVAHCQSMCSPSGVFLNNNSLGSGNYFSNAQAYSYAPQSSKSMNQNGGSENGGYSSVQSNMLSSVGNHGVTQNGINLFASSGLTNVHQYNTSPTTTQYGFVSPHNTMTASFVFGMPTSPFTSQHNINMSNGSYQSMPSMRYQSQLSMGSNTFMRNNNMGVESVSSHNQQQQVPKMSNHNYISTPPQNEAVNQHQFSQNVETGFQQNGFNNSFFNGGYSGDSVSNPHFPNDEGTHNNSSNNTNAKPRATWNFSNVIVCQICEKPGHGAWKCYQRNPHQQQGISSYSMSKVVDPLPVAAAPQAVFLFREAMSGTTPHSSWLSQLIVQLLHF